MVTGAGGFVGRHLVRRLETDGATVAPLPRAIDVRDADAVRRAVENSQPTAVIHLAGRSTRDGSDFDTNRLGTIAMLGAVRAARVDARVVIASTDALTHHDPVDAYERSKSDAEAAATCA